MVFQRIGITSDHAGRELKAALMKFLQQTKLAITDFGVDPTASASVDYPDYAAKLAESVSRGQLDGGIAVCGTGIGMAITANKFAGVRAASVWDDFSCRMARAHNDCNILCLGSRTLDVTQALALLELWLTTPFAGERHGERLAKISQLEKTLYCDQKK